MVVGGIWFAFPAFPSKFGKALEKFMDTSGQSIEQSGGDEDPRKPKPRRASAAAPGKSSAA